MAVSSISDNLKTRCRTLVSILEWTSRSLPCSCRVGSVGRCSSQLPVAALAYRIGGHPLPSNHEGENASEEEVRMCDDMGNCLDEPRSDRASKAP